MQYAKTSLAKSQAAQFREYLELAGLSCRDPKGQYELFQVKIGNQWPAVCFNSADQVSAPEAVAQYVPLFKKDRKARDKEIVKVPAAITLRDELAMLAAENLMPTSEHLGQLEDDKAVIFCLQANANACYTFADCMLKARAQSWLED